jgi:hypothetical protein
MLERPTVYLVVREVRHEGERVEGVYERYHAAEGHANCADATNDQPDITYRVDRWRCGDLAGVMEYRAKPKGVKGGKE